MLKQELVFLFIEKKLNNLLYLFWSYYTFSEKYYFS